jgi:hypothetical protein
MSFNLCTNIIMSFINEVVSYSKMALGEWTSIAREYKSKNDLMSFYKDDIINYYIKHWWNNMLINLLIELEIINVPIHIKFPRWFKKWRSQKLLWQWVYQNYCWTIFYDYWQISAFDYSLWVHLKYPYPNLIMVLAIKWDLKAALEKNKFILKEKLWSLDQLSITKFSEQKKVV